jgi:hypothetical protein
MLIEPTAHRCPVHHMSPPLVTRTSLMYHMRGVFQAKSTAAGAFALRFQDYQARWYDYSRARDAMLKATDTNYASWLIVKSDDKRRARLNCISKILELVALQESAACKGQIAKTIYQVQI